MELLNKFRPGTSVTVYHHPTVSEASKMEIPDIIRRTVHTGDDYPGGIEMYKPISSPSTQLLYARRDIQGISVGNALLIPGTNMITFFTSSISWNNLINFWDVLLTIMIRNSTI